MVGATALAVQLDPEKRPDIIRLRIGIHTGQVVVRNIGAGERYEPPALGETPNMGGRIQSIAKTDTMVISAATFRLVESFFECYTLGQHVLLPDFTQK